MPEDTVTLPELDDPPDVWVEEHPTLTDEEIHAGNALGETIDVEDDEDVAGVVPLETVETARPATEPKTDLEVDDES